MAEEKKQEMLDPVAYRSDYNPSDIQEEFRDDPNIPGVGPQNANENYQEYGDDSNPAWQNQRGGLNPKYEGEGTANTYIDYNPDLTVADLDPNYLYGENARQQNSKEKGYIARRNDNIASALYNEGLVGREDVAKFLGQQSGWMDSTEEDRLNTIESIWKRLGQIQPKEEEEKPDLSKAEEIRTDTSGKIYGKTTAEEGNPSKGIDTLADANSVFTSMQESRAANLKSLVSMKPETVAELELSGVSPYGEQTMRDAQQLYPEFMAQVEAAKKKKLGQENVNAIASGGEITTMADKVDTSSQATSYAVNNSSSSVSPTQLLKSIDERLIESDSAQSAKDLMLDIKNSETQLKNRMRNLKQEANSKFKGDVPDYLVNAYINNKSQEIQNQLSILADRYSSAYDIYKTELAHAEWQSELDLKKDSLALEDWKAKNTTTSSTSTNNSNYTVAERNNNPTNMTVGFMERAGAELGVDYEVSSDSFRSNGKQLYYAKLIGDPIDTTIRILDKAIAQGKNPFNTTSWSYINKLGLTVDKWNKMSQQEKQDMIRKWLPYEGGNMENMAYYISKGNESTYGVGYNTELGYNPYMKDIYESYLKKEMSKSDIEGYEKTLGEGELGRQALNYAKAKESGIDAYDNGSRNVDETYGFILDKKPIYAEIVKANYNVPDTRKKELEESLGINPKDPKAWEKVVNETLKYQAFAKTELDTRASEILEALEYIIMQDTMKVQRNAMFKEDENGNYDEAWYNKMSAEDDTYRAYYQYLRDNLTFDKLIELKKSGATFGALSNQELDAIATAASGIRWEKDDAAFKRAINSTYKALRDSIGREIDDEALNKMWNAEEHNDFTNYIIIKKGQVTSPRGLWQWSYGRSNNEVTEEGTEEELNKLNELFNNVGTGS